MGRAISMGHSSFVGARVAGQMTYIPAYFKNGKKINAKCEIPVYMNIKGQTEKDGDAYKVTAWGKLADTCAKSLPKGKAIDVFTRQKPYEGDLYDEKGQLRLDATGQTIRIPKIGFTIYDIIFGEESDKTVAEEVSTGRRPINWDTPNHPDKTLWESMLQERQTAVWNGTDTTFGYARVYVPQGQGIQLDFSKPGAPATTTPAPIAPAQTVPVAPAFTAPAAPAAGAAGAPDVAAITAAVIASLNATPAPVTPAAPVVPFVQEQGTNMPLF